MLSNLSLRGGHRPTWQSRSTRTDHRKATGENVAGCRRFPRRFAPRNDKPVCLTPPNYYCNTCDCLWRSLSAATDANGAYHFTLTSMGRKCLPEIATGAKRPRNDTSGSAKVHQRPCTVELPRTGRTGSAAAIRPASWCGRWSGRKFESIVRSTMPTYHLPACMAVTDRRYRCNRFLRFYRQPVQVGSTAQGAARRSPTAHVCLLISQNYSLFIFQYL